MQRIVGMAALIGLTVCGTVAAQSKPDFSGDWKMNAEASNFGGMPAPSSLTEKIAHEEPTVKVTTAQSGEFGDWNSDFIFTTDGKECLNKVADFQVKSTLKWDGSVLVVDSTMDFQGSPATMTDRWSLSEDGKTMTIDRHFSGPMGPGEGKIVFGQVKKGE